MANYRIKIIIAIWSLLITLQNTSVFGDVVNTYGRGLKPALFTKLEPNYKISGRSEKSDEVKRLNKFNSNYINLIYFGGNDWYKKISSFNFDLSDNSLELNDEVISDILSGLVFKDNKGNIINVSELRGKVVLFDFWAGWCKPCIVQLPHLKQMYKKYKNLGLEIIGVSLDNSRDDFEKSVKKYDIPWPIYFKNITDGDSLPNLLKVRAIPYHIVLNKFGKVEVKDNLATTSIEKTIFEMLGD